MCALDASKITFQSTIHVTLEKYVKLKRTQITSLRRKTYPRLNLFTLFLIALSCFYTVSAPAASNEIIQTQLQNALNQYREQRHVPAMVMSITSHDKTNPYHYTLVSGTIARQTKIPVTKDSLFQVGSITKSFVAATLLKIEANPTYKFNIHQPLSKWLPQYPQWGKITIQQLLNHTSGIYNYSETILDNGTNKYPSKRWTDQALVAIAAQHPLYFKPGQGWHYSNTNYILAAMVVHAVTGKSLTDNMQNLISNTGLVHTYYKPKQYPANLLPKIVHGYDIKGQDITRKNLSWASAAGALISNATDIDRWISALLTPNKILPKKQWLELQSIVCQNKGPADHCWFAGMPTTVDASNAPTYGLGIAHYKNIWWHDGSTLGYSAIMLYAAPQKITISITANLGYREITNDFNPLTEKISQILWGTNDKLIVY